MDDKIISSSANPVIKRIRALGQRKHREERGEFFVEGIRPVWQAVASGADLRLLVHAPDLLTSDSAREMVRSQATRNTETITVTGKIFESLGQREHPSGLGAVVGIVPRRIQDLAISSSSVLVALVQAGNPGNIGTILRTLDAVGGSALLLVGRTADPYHPASVKASMGSLFSIPIVRVSTIDDFLAWCRSMSVNVVTTSPRAEPDFWSVEYPMPLVLLFGSEAEGLPEGTLKQGAIAVRIPMKGTSDSLNLAVSVGVLLYEVERQRYGAREALMVTN